MAQSTKEANSAFKIARLQRAFRAFRSNKLDMKFVEQILQTEGDINYRVPSNQSAGCTVLHMVLECVEVFRQLLKHGADFTIKNAREETVLHTILNKFTHFTHHDKYDVSWGFTEKWSNEVVHAILTAHLETSRFENPGDKYGLTHFHIACMADHAAAVRMFLDNGVPVDLAINELSPLFPGCTPLDVAARCCALEVVKVLLEYFDDERAKDKAVMTAMHWLIECNRRVVDDFIVEERSISPDKWISKFQVNQQIMHLLYDSRSCSCTSDIGLSDLHVACTTGNITAVKDLLDHGVQINHQVNENSHLWPGYTALHFAAHFNCEAVHLLLSKGANIAKKSKNGSTPFDICVQRYGVKDIHSIISSQSEWSGITLQDGKTKLINLVSAMQDIDLFKTFLDLYIGNVNTSVSKSSPLWPGYTPLHLAVLFTEQTKNRSNYSSNEKGDYSTCKLELVEECLIRGAVTAQDLFGSTPLHLAFDNLKAGTIARLLQFHQNSANPIDRKNVSHLHIACASGDEKSVEKLLRSGTNVNLAVLSEYKIFYRKTPFECGQVRLIPVGSTPLHIAVATENCEVIKRLIDNGADVNATDENGVSPIHSLLVEHWHAHETAKILLSANLREVVSDARISHLHVASYFGNVDAVKRLLDIGADVEVRLGCQSALLDLCDRYNTKKGRVNISSWNCAGATAWHLAVWQESKEVAQLLSSRVPHLLTLQITDVWRNGLGWEFGLDNVISCQLLVDNEVLARRMKEYHGLTALHLACYEANLATVQKLIDDGMDVNARCNAMPKGWRERGYTPLHMLIKGYPSSSFDESLGQLEKKVLEITRVLLDAGADVSLCDETGSTALHHLLIDNTFENTGGFHTDMLNMMLNGIQNFRVNPIPTSYDLRISLFHIACLESNTTIIRKFLEHGVDANAVVDLFSCQNEGYSPLLLVVDDIFGYYLEAPKYEAIDALLEHGADVNAQNLDGDTTLHKVAHSMSDQVDILARLISTGADLSKLNNVCETPFDTLLLSDMATPEGVQLFIEQGCPVNAFNVVDEQGCLSRPLFAHRRAQDRAKIFETLFKSPRVTEVDAMGRTAIHNIVSTAATKISRYDKVVNSENVSVDELCSLITRLCKKGCDIDCRDRLGRTALHVAASFKNNKAVVALLMNGADVNVTDSCSVVAFKYCFDPCERQLIKTFCMHLRKLEYLRLTVNETNKNLIDRANLELGSANAGLNEFHREMNKVNSLTFKKDADSFKLRDMLSETGLIAVYPFNVTLKVLADNFIDNVDGHLAKYGEIIGLFKLQHRKAKERVNLIEPAAESLNQVAGFPFPEICRQSILRFLSNSDFENLIYIAYLSELSHMMPEDSLKLLSEAASFQQNLLAHI